MMELVKILGFMFVVVLCIFRISEMNWRKTLWLEAAGFMLACIGAFWKAMVYAHMYTGSPAEVKLQDDIAALLFIWGMALILFVSTCRKVERRSTARAPKVIFPEDVGHAD